MSRGASANSRNFIRTKHGFYYFVAVEGSLAKSFLPLPRFFHKREGKMRRANGPAGSTFLSWGEKKLIKEIGLSPLLVLLYLIFPPLLSIRVSDKKDFLSEFMAGYIVVRRA